MSANRYMKVFLNIVFLAISSCTASLPVEFVLAKDGNRVQFPGGALFFPELKTQRIREKFSVPQVLTNSRFPGGALLILKTQTNHAF